MPAPIQTADMKNYFEDIYAAALVAETNFLQAYQLVDAIYQVAKGVDVHSPIHKCVPSYKLAKENQRKAVELLIRFGANFKYLIAGAACGGQEAWALQLCENYNQDKKLITPGLISRDADAYLDRFATINTEEMLIFISHAAAQKNDYLLIKYFLKYFIIPALVILEKAAIEAKQEIADEARLYAQYNDLYDLINRPASTIITEITTENPESLLFQHDLEEKMPDDSGLITALNNKVTRVMGGVELPAEQKIFIGAYVSELLKSFVESDITPPMFLNMDGLYQGQLSKLYALAAMLGDKRRQQNLRDDDFDDEFYPPALNELWRYAQQAAPGRLQYTFGLIEILVARDEFSLLAENLCFWGYFTDAEKLRQQQPHVLSKCISGAIRGGHFHYAYALWNLDKKRNFYTWTTTILDTRQFKFITSDQLSMLKIYTARNSIMPLNYNFSLLALLQHSPDLIDTDKIAILKEFLGIRLANRNAEDDSLPSSYNYLELRAFAKPELNIWFRHGKRIMQDKNLSESVFHLISTYLSPMQNYEAEIFFNNHSLRASQIRLACSRIDFRTVKTLLANYAKNSAVFKPPGFQHFYDMFRASRYLGEVHERLTQQLNLTRDVNFGYSDYRQLINECCRILKRHAPNYRYQSLVMDAKIVPPPYDVRNDPEEFKRVFIENYMREYNIAFFKNSLSSMLRDIKNNTVTVSKIKKHAADNPVSRTAKIVADIKSQGKDLPLISQFKKAYLDKYKSEFFKNPWSAGRQNISSITSIKQIQDYAQAKPNSRTALILKRTD